MTARLILRQAANRPPDPKTAEAKTALLMRYFEAGTAVYYQRQLEIWLEKEFFHWITARALGELRQTSRAVGHEVEELKAFTAHFYFPFRHRYPQRQINQTIKLISAFSQPDFTRAVGHHGEMLVEAAFARLGFRILQQKVRAVDGLAWAETDHDLDFLIMRDGIRYGVEVKNQLSYIEGTEFRVKLKMCAFFGVRPLFITRMLPSSYLMAVHQAGGYAMLTANQNYPLLAEALARDVRDTLALPVAVTREIPVSALDRFESWHDRHR